MFRTAIHNYVGGMEIIKTGFEGLYILKPLIHRDHRGLFLESFRASWFRDMAAGNGFVQENESRSALHVLRGLHFQKPPFAQGKLIRVIQGAVQDVCVDIRQGSGTYGKHLSIRLSADVKTMLYVPPGFAHGFLSLCDDTILNYKCTNYFNAQSEGSVRWNDPLLGIEWETNDPILSEKDRIAPLFNGFITPFSYVESI